MGAILVTGGAGFVGAVAVPMLLERGYGVRVLDNLMYGQASLLGCFANPDFEFVRGDIRDKECVKRVMEGVDCIIHLAAVVGAPACRKDPELSHKVNVEGVENLLGMRRKGCPFIFASTVSLYGSSEQICDENSRIMPASEYARTKAEAEKIVENAGDALIYRFATGFGVSPRLRLDLMVNDFTFQAVKNGYLLLYEKNFKRTFLHVKDMAKALLHGVENYPEMAGELFNAGCSSMNFSKEQVALKVKECVDYQIYYADIGNDPDRRNYSVSFEKILQTGFESGESIGSGIMELAAACEMVSLKNPYSNIEKSL